MATITDMCTAVEKYQDDCPSLLMLLGCALAIKEEYKGKFLRIKPACFNFST